MSTRSYIGIARDNGIDVIYCHFDGYPSYNGDILTTYYTDREMVEKLIALGSISSLRARIEPNANEKHTFDEPINDVTVAYHRDRGEKYEPPVHFKSLDDVIKDADCSWVEYIYIFYNGMWNCYGAGDGNAINLYGED